MISGPDWAVFSVEEVNELGQRKVLGASVCSTAGRLMYDSFAETHRNADVMFCHGATVLTRSKPHWPLCGGKPK